MMVRLAAKSPDRIARPGEGVAMEIKEYIREFTLKDIVKVRNPRVVAFGGGTGLSTILRGLKKYTSRLTAVVTVGDDGGSSGMLREDLGILPPGDIRNCILALSDDENVMQSLFNYRFNKGGLKGHSFGNLFLAAMDGISADFYDAVKRTSDVLQISGRVLPVTLDDMTLIGELKNGRRFEGESDLPKAAINFKSPIARVSLKTPALALPETLEAILEADIIILGPGSLYTSIIPHLLVDGIEEAIMNSRARKFYVGNIMTQPGETIGYSQNDHVRAIETHQRFYDAAHPIFQYIIANQSDFEQEIIMRYQQMGSRPVTLGEKVPEYTYITDEFAVQENGKVRHDADYLAQKIFKLYTELGRIAY